MKNIQSKLSCNTILCVITTRSFRFSSVFLFSLLWMLFWSRDRANPVIFFDETWLMYKAYLLNHFGHWFAPPNIPDVNSFYAPLYSVISSLVFRGRDPIGAYSSVLQMNAVLLSLGAASLVLLPRDFVPARWATICALCVGLSPGYAGYSSLAMSEALFLPLFVVLTELLLCHSKHSTFRTWLLSLIVASLCLLTRKIGVSILLTVPALFVIGNWSVNRQSPLSFFSIVVTFIILLLTWKYVGDLSFQRGSTQTTSSYVTRILLNWRNLLQPIPVFGQIAYLNIASGFLLIPSLLWLIQPDLDGTRRPWRVLLLVIIPFVIPGILHMYIHSGMTTVADTRYLMYGRYVDPVVPYFIVTGLLGLFRLEFNSGNPRKNWWWALLCVAAMITITALFCPMKIAGIHVLNVGAGWITIADKILRGFGGRWMAMTLLGIALSIAIYSRVRWHKWSFIIVTIVLAVASLSAQRRMLASLVSSNDFKIKNLLDARRKGFFVARRDSSVPPQTSSQATFYLADKYIGGAASRNRSVAPKAFLERSGAIVPIDNGIFFDFVQAGDRAVFNDTKTQENPWGRTAVLLNSSSFGPGILLTMPESSVSFTTVPLQDGSAKLSVIVGYYPQARSWNVSDGVVCSIRIWNGSGREIIWSRRFLPKDNPLPLSIPLDEFADSIISVEFRSSETGGNQAGDWVFFGQPVLLRSMSDSLNE